MPSPTSKSATSWFRVTSGELNRWKRRCSGNKSIARKGTSNPPRSSSNCSTTSLSAKLGSYCGLCVWPCFPLHQKTNLAYPQCRFQPENQIAPTSTLPWEVVALTNRMDALPTAHLLFSTSYWPLDHCMIHDMYIYIYMCVCTIIYRSKILDAIVLKNRNTVYLHNLRICLSCYI